MDAVISGLVGDYCSDAHEDGWDLEELARAVQAKFAFAPENLSGKNSANDVAEEIYAQAEAVVAAKEAEMGLDVPVSAYRHFYLREIDRQWLDHLEGMDHLRSGIGLRGYGQRDPKQEYKREGYELFTAMMGNIKDVTIEKVFHVRIESKEDVQRIAMPRRSRKTVEGRGGGGAMKEKPTKQGTVKREAPKVGRNDACPCGSGKKYKKCCGKNAA